MNKDYLLEVNNLQVTFKTNNTEVHAVRGVNFQLKEKETLAIVGESGSGKSVTAQSIIKLISEPPGKINNGSIFYKGEDLLTKPERYFSSIRGKEISMIFQDPMSSLNPTLKIGRQIAETIIRHEKVNKETAYKRTIELLKLVGIPNPEKRIDQYPYEFSGGMRQRVMIAIALSCNPKILIADEPTTALDVTIQAQIIELLNDLQQKLNMSTIIITHDLGVVANMAHRVVVMYGGKVAETGTVDEIFYQPKHPYTWGLLSSIPKLDSKEKKLIAIDGSPPNLANPPKGCPFAPRCPYAMKVCIEQSPGIVSSSDTQKTACWLLDEQAPITDTPETARIEG
ncbi:ABC transporter ATP-binding protein [Pseudogracilibacillus auburnensis]|uniref:Oligopeptide transport system ATP-binding protein n=1 Tax=Pseudogracilibacillus auburnensis TaxID=1494959 RepID=A0A2V3VLG4_9BACI|nr:ABC transporter ATP-binding protein [Pseudogracilibacillus auburnensis]MBO1002511.1 ABC transporter ATP-binding protein [Pseudogracilibacillus auburnensis]PXW82647.1 oligopeptide transport system ATP-binding protein [Pseudogracilibacillus auburnensis]